MAGRVSALREQLITNLHDGTKPWTNILTKAERTLGVDRLYIFMGTIIFVGLWLAFGYAAQLLCNILGLVYPTYMSIKAIQSKQKDDDTKWLTYWVVFGTFSVLEYFSNFIVGWFGLYWLTKCVFLLWLMMPGELNGAVTLYYRVIYPFFIVHHGSIDMALNKVKESASKYLVEPKND